MRISVKGRYALAAVIQLAEKYGSGDCMAVNTIAERLGISKIYLEQVFSLLKRGAVVNSTKGSQGGYHLTRTPQQTTVLDVLSAVELPLFEPAGNTVQDMAPDLDATMQSAVFTPMDDALNSVLAGIALSDLVADVERRRSDQTPMFYI